MKLYWVICFSGGIFCQFIPDIDGKCQLLDATCDHNGFKIEFDMTCRDLDYRGVSISELYANGWNQATSLATYGSSLNLNPECLFSQHPTDSTKYIMKFNFRQCGTDHIESDADNLIYRNTIQAQEYNSEIIMGAQVRFQVKCTGGRTAEITTETNDITGDTDFNASNDLTKPSNWIDNILQMDFFSDDTYESLLGWGNQIYFGDSVFTKITAINTDEDIFPRVTACWATPNSDPSDSPRFDLMSNSCPIRSWFNIISSDNGLSESIRFKFRSFRFPNQMSFFLHCEVYLCHSTEMNCIQSCDRRRRDTHSVPETTLPRIISAQIIVFDRPESDTLEAKIESSIKAVESRLKKIKKSIKGFSQAIKRSKNL